MCFFSLSKTSLNFGGAYFAHSSKCQSQYAVIQNFADVEPHRILRPCQTRWLCVARMIEQWDALVAYFQIVSQTDNLLVSDKILNNLQKSYLETIHAVLKLCFD